MKRIGIAYRAGSPAAADLAARLEQQLAQQGIDVWIDGAREAEGDGDTIAASDLMLVLGGDGTILSTARLCAMTNTPILGINFGHVGFLTELEPDEVEQQLPLYLQGDYWIDERAMLSGTLEVDGQRDEFLALNDIVVVRGGQPRVIRFRLWIDSYYYTTMTADGVIVATATGSTAYNLAAGGPILHPAVRSSVLTPVAPHLAADRPIVLDPSSVVRLELLDTSAGAILSADGQINRPFDGEATVTIANSPYVTRFLRRRPRSHFYHALSTKIGER
ncbi:MAG TPA: NAD(+)/NADH kinase [Ktedonobacterales bacterium]|nr:NAD(+)/NADH kinase [Ktedonobacterales bacterium]